MFQGVKVLGTFPPEEQKFHRNKSSKERMFYRIKVLSVHFLLPGTKVQRNEKSDIPKPNPTNPNRYAICGPIYT